MHHLKSPATLVTDGNNIRNNLKIIVERAKGKGFNLMKKIAIIRQ
ncbi:MAG: hypothetical protein HeimC3_42140 [Candidatus Heimdallarchaeota archaeon LC_3]|nr:MAG: hypothetical protein HeimC3_42140 [Candidatus Heimdallarchaeota archaeon LC_3]